MRMTSGRIVGGRVEFEGELPEGAAVMVITHEDDETFEADPETEAMLLRAIGQCERGETVPMTRLLGELRTRE